MQVENEDHGARELLRSLVGRGNAGDSPLLQKRMKRLIRFEMRVRGGEAF